MKLSEEKFAVQITLARRLLERLSDEVRGMETRFAHLSQFLPVARQRLLDAERRREDTARARAAAEGSRADIASRLAGVRLEIGRLDGDLALAAERLSNASARKHRALEERAQLELRAQQASSEREAAATDLESAAGGHERIRGELTTRAAAEEEVRRRLGEQRQLVRQWEQELQEQAQTQRSLEGERAALEGELSALRDRAAQAAAHRGALQDELAAAEQRRSQTAERAGFLGQEAKRAAAEAERARHLVAEAREQEALHRADRRHAEELLAQMTARRHALEELERDRVGLAPAAAALLAARGRFGDGVLGPLSDFVTTGRESAELTERLLGDWMHAVLVRDHEVVGRIQEWHAQQQPGALVLLPLDPGPTTPPGDHALDDRLRVQGPAVGWVRAALAGSEALDSAGRVLRRASGAIFLSGAGVPSGPLRRRAELGALAQDVERGTAALGTAEAVLAATVDRLAERERGLTAATAAADLAREAERQAAAAREDVTRLAANLSRESTDSEAELERVTERLTRSETRMREIDAALVEGDLAQSRLEESLGEGRARLAGLESEQEAAREHRVHWQVQEAHIAGGLRSAEERLHRASTMREEAERGMLTLAGELGRLDSDRDSGNRAAD